MNNGKKESRRLTAFFVESLKVEFSFLTGWEPQEVNSAQRPVTLKVSRVLDRNIVWSLTYGKWNNTPDRSYTDGVTAVAISDGETLEIFKLEEGETRPEDIIKENTRFVLVKYEYRSELVENDPGYIEYTLYKRGEETVAEIKADASRAAAAIRAQLE